MEPVRNVPSYCSAANASLVKRVRLPLGTAVHASIEDLLNMDLEGRDGGETGWLLLTAEGFLKTRWDEEEVFMTTPRRPDWKDAKWTKPKSSNEVASSSCSTTSVPSIWSEQVTVALRHLQSLTIAVEGER